MERGRIQGPKTGKPRHEAMKPSRDPDILVSENGMMKSAKMLAKKTHSRRRAIVTPIKKAPASLKASREEAARIKASQGAKAAKLSPKKDRGNEEGSDDEGGLTEREKSRRRAAQWAKDQKGKKAQDKKGEATAAAAATPGKRPRGENE